MVDPGGVRIPGSSATKLLLQELSSHPEGTLEAMNAADDAILHGNLSGDLPFLPDSGWQRHAPVHHVFAKDREVKREIT